MGGIPKEWLGCPSFALDVITDKFVVCKTPLSDQFDGRIPKQMRFKPEMVFTSRLCREKNVGLWIDLTNTDRYYNQKFIQSTGCKYKKLACAGHYQTPTQAQSRQFIDIVHTFSYNRPNDYVVVHCTHGFNRTGFCIISYLVEKMKFLVRDAVNLFAEVRPPGIYKNVFIRELFRRYDNVSAAPAAPLKPNWCVEDVKDARKDVGSSREQNCDIGCRGNKIENWRQDDRDVLRNRQDGFYRTRVFVNGDYGASSRSSEYRDGGSGSIKRRDRSRARRNQKRK